MLWPGNEFVSGINGIVNRGSVDWRIGWANFMGRKNKNGDIGIDIAIVRITDVTVLPLNTRTDSSRVITLTVTGALQFVNPATACAHH